jgi:archaemetzincin
MKRISLIPLGKVSRKHLEVLAESLTTTLQVPCSPAAEGLDIESAYDALRGQYHSTAILSQIRDALHNADTRLLGVTDADLFVPIFTFVFGEAQLGPRNATTAIVSLHRLRQEFYGLAPDFALLSARLLKEALHEIGHTLGLRHCRDYRCVMSSSPAVENIDLKNPRFCARCEERLNLSGEPIRAAKDG